jgi:hypothetical protein
MEEYATTISIIQPVFPAQISNQLILQTEESTSTTGQSPTAASAATPAAVSGVTISATTATTVTKTTDDPSDFCKSLTECCLILSKFNSLSKK